MRGFCAKILFSDNETSGDKLLRSERMAYTNEAVPDSRLQDFLVNTGQAGRNILEIMMEGNGYMAREQSLRDLKEVDICTVQKESLVDIKNVEIDINMERMERIAEYIKQIKNPYCFVCEGVIVKLNFAQTEETLGDKLNNYFESL